MHPQSSQPTDLLRYSHPDWVDALSRGAGVVFWGLAIGAAALVTGELFPHHLASFQPYRLAALAGAVLLLRGAWRLTSADTAGHATSGGTALRWGLRLGLAVGVAGGSMKVVVAASLAGQHATALSAAALVAAAADVCARLALLRHLRGLSLRLPDPNLARRFAPLVPAYGIALGAAAGVEALRTLPVVRHRGLPSAIVVAAVTAVILRHVARLGRGLVIQTDYARGIWAKSHGAVSTPSSQQSRAA
jgi:hypothetical protein